jgi:acetolactate synthase-1/2/3 large subunit
VKRADLKGNSGLRQSGVQEIDIVSIVKSITKYAVTILEPDSIRFHLEKAVHLAMTGRKGPVWIDIPLDVQAAQVKPAELAAFTPEDRPGITASALSREVTTAIGILQSAERPVLLLGNGIRSAGAVEQAQAWAEKLQAPVLTTWLGLDLLPQSNPLLIGRPGGIAPRGSNFTLQNCDCLISVGARLDPIVTGYAHDKFARAAKKIIVDIDPAEIQKLKFSIAAPIAADAAAFFAEWERQAPAKWPSWDPWLSRCQTWKKKYPLLQPEHMPKPGLPLSTYYFAKILSDLLPEDQLIVPGSSGFACEIFFLMLEAKRGQRILHNRGTGAMGFSIPSALGASIAAGNSGVVSVDGDGGFHMNLQELAPIVGLRLPIKFFVCNNNGYASIRSSQNNYFKGRRIASDEGSGLYLPSLEKMAEAYGVAYRRIESSGDEKAQIQQVLATAGPVICEVIVRQDEARVPRLASSINADGSMTSRPLEDLFPFLERDEFREIMLIPPLQESSG